MNKSNLIGQKFGKLTVIADDGTRNKNQRIMWLCRCGCGNTTHANGSELKSGHTKSCGCGKGANKEYMDLIRNPKSRKRSKPTVRNTSGYRGVYFNKARKKWYAMINADGKSIYLGSSNQKNEAIEFRKLAEIKYGYKK